jgi:acyl-CoA reductase-like NAD-dependent aldehyde dehydrogenase
VAFTGSAATGRLIQSHAASVAVKTVTLELGGKNPIVVLPDADIDDAIDGAVRGMNFTWQGQSCGSTSRLLVHSSLREEFVGRLAERLDALICGDPADEATETGAIVSRSQYDKVLSYIDIASRDGARAVAGGGPADVAGLPDGLFVRPTLFEDVGPDARVAQEEIFGPVLVVLPFERESQALEIANGVAYGLTASVFTRDLEAALRFVRGAQAGVVWVNDSATHVPGLSFGGVKDSGIGREESLEELESYTQIKSVTVKLSGRSPA